MKTIYISGPMSGIENLNFPAFNAAAERLRGCGLKVINPAEINTDAQLTWEQCMRADAFCHGYALTVHKSQGSQWDNVLLYDESNVFREASANHLYTGVTRAAEKVTVVI